MTEPLAKLREKRTDLQSRIAVRRDAITTKREEIQKLTAELATVSAAIAKATPKAAAKKGGKK